MSGISRHNGQPLTRDAHIAQSLGVLLNTPVGSRVLRRDYGSNLPRLIDAPISPANVIDIYAATAEAIALWEPRVNLRRVQIADAAPGQMIVALEAAVDGADTLETIPVEIAT